MGFSITTSATTKYKLSLHQDLRFCVSEPQTYPKAKYRVSPHTTHSRKIRCPSLSSNSSNILPTLTEGGLNNTN
ncbi:hypothetical protein JTE90_015502 [Oedothorax gibbosus]|uniref:Uncharacterized protein n=1 Tax=Oedothorax gibbosus TaxID=931172 RepID=A0AAV6VPV5_9ARAC|nr:hypothetical protein JTE90_015502 [Oedothorax gibbosus]